MLILVAAALGVGLLLALLILGGRHSVTPGHRHVVTVGPRPAAKPPQAGVRAAGQAGAIAAAHVYAQSFATGRHAYGYRVLSFHHRKALIEFVAPENIAGSVRWWVFDAPAVYGPRGWWINGPWMTLDQAGSPPPPLNAYKQWSGT